MEKPRSRFWRQAPSIVLNRILEEPALLSPIHIPAVIDVVANAPPIAYHSGRLSGKEEGEFTLANGQMTKRLLGNARFEYKKQGGGALLILRENHDVQDQP